jgi:hypothetical protein
MAEWLLIWFTVVIPIFIYCNFFLMLRGFNPLQWHFFGPFMLPCAGNMADGYVLQIHNQLVMLSLGIELGIKNFSFANSGFIIAIVEHPNLKTKLRFLQPINPMLKRICYCLLLSLCPLQVFFGNTKYGKRFGHVDKQ